MDSFNSLQTGKCIQRRRRSKMSIRSSKNGFNSLQTGKCIQRALFLSLSRTFFSFNSLQTGKCIQSLDRNLGFCRRISVSIPFKRESVFRVLPEPSISAFPPLFQFPSNGKVYSEKKKKLASRQKKMPLCFNSLQTGKCIQSWG